MRCKVSASDVRNLTLNETNTVSSILQAISIILQTAKGSVPLYRDFGISMEFLDRPMPAVKPTLAVTVKEAIEEFEPRVEVINITFTEDSDFPGKLVPIVEVEINE